MRRVLTFPVLLILFSVNALIAQSTITGVSGRVTDTTGATLPNARVELVNIDTGQRLSTTSDASGNYQFNDVPPGRYRVSTASSSASASSATPGQEITIDASRATTLNISIPSGPGTDTVAQAETVNIDTRPASVSNVYNSRYIHYLPQPNFIDRNGQAFGAYNLSVLSEASNGSLAGFPGGPAIGGQRPNTNNYHVDGIDNNSLLSAGPVVYVSNEATTEFALFQNQPAPLFGQSGGGKFNSIVRTGNNVAHGSIYDYLQNRHLNAIDRSFAARGFDDNLRYDQNRMGATLGLPIIPSKMFFFGNFEYIPLRFDSPTGGFQYAPTTAGFAALSGIRGVSATNLGILRSATAGMVDPANVGTTVFNTPVALGLVNNTFRYTQERMVGTGAMDWTLSDKDQFRLRYTHNEMEANSAGSGLSAFQTPRWSRAFVASAAHYHTFANAITNELRFGYTRNNQEQYGLTNQPNIFIGQGFNLGLGSSFLPTGVTNTYHLADGVGLHFGSHNIRVGFDGRRFIGSRGNFPEFAGTYGYSTLERFLIDLPPDVFSNRAFGNSTYNFGQWNWFGYVHDTWSVKPGLTIDAGLRYQYSTIPAGLRWQGMNNAAGIEGLQFNEPERQLTNFAPYFGFAWTPPFGRNTVLRGGFGIYHDAFNWSPIMFGFAPLQTRVLQGNLFSNAPNFLATGGLQDPAAFGDNGTPTTAQLRAATNSYIANQQMPYSMQWNIALQQSVWHGATLELKYLGNRGMHLPVFGQYNFQGVTAERSLPVFDTRPTQSTLNGLGLTLAQLQQPQSNVFTQAGFTNPLNTVNYDGNSCADRRRSLGAFGKCGSSWHNYGFNLAGDCSGDRA